MSKVFIEESTLSAIGDAIRGKTGGTELIAPLDMPSEIEGIVSGGGSGDNGVYIDVIEGDAITITKEDLKGCTKIGEGAFEYCRQLTSVELPDTITELGGFCLHYTNITELTIPPKVTKIGQTIVRPDFSSKLRTVTLLCEDVPTLATSTSFGTEVQQILVRGELLDEYLQTSNWVGYANKISPYNEYCSIPMSSTILAKGDELNISIPLLNFDYEPECAIETDNDNVIISDESVTNTEVSFKIIANTEGDTTISVCVGKNNGFVFERTIKVTVVSEIIYPTWTIEDVEGATYGFALNEAGYYESQNKGQQNSFAYCKVVFHNPMNFPIYIDCISYAESSYDYGILSHVNKSLSLTNTPDTVGDPNLVPAYVSFQSRNMESVQTITYKDIIGDCFITIKYRKDASGDKNNDTLQFKIRYE